MRVEGRESSLLSDAELDDIVRNIRAVAPEAGLLMVQRSRRQQGLMVQRVRVMHSLHLIVEKILSLPLSYQIHVAFVSMSCRKRQESLQYHSSEIRTPLCKPYLSVGALLLSALRLTSTSSFRRKQCLSKWDRKNLCGEESA